MDRIKATGTATADRMKANNSNDDALSAQHRPTTTCRHLHPTAQPIGPCSRRPSRSLPTAVAVILSIRRHPVHPVLLSLPLSWPSSCPSRPLAVAVVVAFILSIRRHPVHPVLLSLPSPSPSSCPSAAVLSILSAVAVSVAFILSIRRYPVHPVRRGRCLHPVHPVRRRSHPVHPSLSCPSCPPSPWPCPLPLPCPSAVILSILSAVAVAVAVASILSIRLYPVHPVCRCRGRGVVRGWYAQSICTRRT